MSASYKILPIDLFVRTVKHNFDVEHVFLLGAGASKSSGVPTAKECIWEWKREIFQSNNIDELGKYRSLDWNSDNIKTIIQDWLDNAGSYPPANDPREYSFYAEKSFLNAKTRRKYFEGLFQDKNPGTGYKILCLLAQSGMAKIIFTTNFDGLFVKAAYQADITPKEITIETADLIHQPITGKGILYVALHGDYKYAELKNTEKELDNQSEEFETALKFHLYNKHLIVFGYSGRDKSLMSSLAKAYSVKGSGSLFWCSYKNEVSQDVKNLLKKATENHREAYLIPTEGFDETLLNITRYCFSDNKDFQEKLNKIVQIKDVRSADEAIKVEPVSKKVSNVVNGDAHFNNIQEIIVSEPSDRQQLDFYSNSFLSELTIVNFIGEWHESFQSDKDIISHLSKKRYTDWIVNLREVLHHKETPLKLTNGVWTVVDRIALWKVLENRVFDDHLDKFKDCVVEVLKELDPQFELPSEDRYAASIHGKVLKHSPGLRKGMAETLSLLGSYGDTLTNCSQHKPESTAILSIREILGQANWQIWGSLNNLLPTLAEAAPGEFLNSVENALRQKPCPFDELYAQEGAGFAGRNYMTGLLWALEGLSWSEEHLVRVAVILAELASHDPGGNWANRPSNSLTTILLPWHPQTLASIDKRITSIKAIRTDFPDVAWRVLLSLMPNQHQTTSGAHKPRWRNPLPEDWEPNVTNKEYWDQITGYAELAVEMASEDLDKLKELVGKLDNLPTPSFDAVLQHLSSVAIIELPENELLPIWTSLTKFVGKHRRYADAKWALDAEVVARIETTASRLSPTSPEGLYRRLFSNRESDLYEERGNWQEQRKKLDERRQQAIQEILSASGIKGIIAFIDSVESPNRVGLALAEIADNEIDLDLLPDYLEVENINYQQFANGFVWGRYQRQGWHWVDELARTSWSLTQSCQLLMYLPFEVDTWRRASEWLGDSENKYWQKVPVNPYQSDSDLLPAFDKLLEVSRPQAAIDCLNYRLQNKLPLDSERTVRALLGAVSATEPVDTMDSYHITELIKALQNDSATNQNDLARVEWAYLALLNRHGEAEPKLLEARLATQPEFFCEVIRLIFRSKNEEKQVEEPDEQQKAIATNAWRLLHEWKRPPGLHEDGSFSAKDLEVWLENVKVQCRASGHLEVAMIKVGEVLLYCPADPQGLWIVQAAASALNAIDAEDMRSGFRTEVFNSRGVHSVDPTGKPERELAAQWRKKANAVDNEGFARFAATLRGLSDSYDREAERIIEEHKSEGE